MDHGVELGRWVRARREALGLTQEQVAEGMSYDDVDIPTNWVSQLEAGRRKSLPDFPYIERLASALRVLPTDVLRGSGMYPTDVERPLDQAPGSATIHALVDQIDWVTHPERREPVESMLRVLREQDQRASRPKSQAPGLAHGR